jgi:hypothetical protein
MRSTLFFLFSALLFLTANALFAQKEAKVYQMSGLVLKRTTGEPIPFTKISSVSPKRYAISNTDGFFSLPVVARDTLTFECFGFMPKKFSVGDYLKHYKGDTATNYIYSIQYMLEDTITLPTVTIYPYRTPEDIKMAILTMKDPMQVERDRLAANVSPELMSYFMAELPADDNERIRFVQQRYNAMYSQQNMVQSFNLVDPVAIYKLIRHISGKTEGKK